MPWSKPAARMQEMIEATRAIWACWNEGEKLDFRGEFYELKPDAEHLCRNLIYPVPDPKFPFLGVHFTRMIHGGVECGPNAVLAFARRPNELRWSKLKPRARQLEARYGLEFADMLEGIRETGELSEETAEKVGRILKEFKAVFAKKNAG